MSAPNSLSSTSLSLLLPMLAFLEDCVDLVRCRELNKNALSNPPKLSADTYDKANTQKCGNIKVSWLLFAEFLRAGLIMLDILKKQLHLTFVVYLTDTPVLSKLYKTNKQPREHNPMNYLRQK